MDGENRSHVLMSHRCPFQDLPGHPHGPSGQGLTKHRDIELADRQRLWGPCDSRGRDICEWVWWGVSVCLHSTQICFPQAEQTSVRACVGWNGRLSDQLLRLVAELLQCEQRDSHLAKSPTDDKMWTDQHFNTHLSFIFLIRKKFFFYLITKYQCIMLLKMWEYTK